MAYIALDKKGYLVCFFLSKNKPVRIHLKARRLLCVRTTYILPEIRKTNNV